MAERTVKFNLEKETKGALKFQELPTQGKPNLMNSLYLRKEGLEGKPLEIEVTVSYDG